MFDSSLSRAARFIATELKMSPDDEEVLLFGLRLLVHSLAGIVLVVLAGLVTGTLPYMVASAVTASTIRVFSGGAHASSPWRCVLLGALIFSVIGQIARLGSTVLPPPYLPLLVVAAGVFGLWSINRFAPAEAPGKPIRSHRKRDVLRLWARCVLLVWITVGVAASIVYRATAPAIVVAGTLGIVWQSFSLTPVAYGLGRWVDGFLDRVVFRFST